MYRTGIANLPLHGGKAPAWLTNRMRKLAKEITDGTAKALAITCINMLHTTEPRRIVFTGGMIAAGDALLNRIQHYFDEQIWTLKKEPVEICFATLGEDTGIIGAAALAKHVLQQDSEA